MSLLWRNRLLVGLEPHQMVTVQFNGMKKHVSYQQYTKLAHSSPELGWHHVLQQLQQTLSSSKQFKNCELQIVLASDFVRYLALPAHESIVRQSDRVDFARAAYREIYGGVAENWQIKCDDAAPNLTSIAIAVDSALIEALGLLANEHSLQLTSVQPYLMPVFNRVKTQLKTGQLYFAIVESNRILLVSLNNGFWQQIRSFLLEQDWQAQIKNIVQRENIASDSQNEHVLMVYAPHNKSSNLPQIKGWVVKVIDIENRWLQNKSESQHYTMLDAA